MKQVAILFLTSVLLASAPQAANSQEQPGRSKVPVMTSEDVVSAKGAPSEENIVKTNATATPVQSARLLLDRFLGKMSEVNSLKIHMRVSLPTGENDMTVERDGPNRARVTGGGKEVITVGGKVYTREGDGPWQVTAVPSGVRGLDWSLDFVSFAKQMLNKSRVHVTGQILGEEVLDGVNTVAYEFTVSDKSESGTLRLCVGKRDGYVRRFFLNGGQIAVKMWFTNLNEAMSIHAPF